MPPTSTQSSTRIGPTPRVPATRENSPLLLVVLALPALLGCNGALDGDSTNTSPLDDTWVGQLALHPEGFKPLVEADRNGWAAYHAGQLDKAAAQSSDVSARAHRDLAEMYERLGLLETVAWTSILATWDARSGLPKDSGITWFATLAAMESGNKEQAAQWLAMARSVSYPPVAEAAEQLNDGLNLDAIHLDSINVLLKRAATHADARRRGDPGELVASATRPLLLLRSTNSVDPRPGARNLRRRVAFWRLGRRHLLQLPHWICGYRRESRPSIGYSGTTLRNGFNVVCSRSGPGPG